MNLSNHFLEINGVYPKPAAPLSVETTGTGTPPSANAPRLNTPSAPTDFIAHTNFGPIATPAQAQVNPDDHSYVINTRSFAPPVSFGGGFQGDNRGYTTDNAVTSRIHSTISIDTDDQLAVTDNDVAARSDPSIHHAIPFYQPTEIPDIEILHQDIEHDGDVSIVNIRTKHSGEDAVPRITVPQQVPFIGGDQYNPSPSLDVYTDLRLVDNRENNTLRITGEITGDNFPATEVFITDNSGQALFLATGHPPAIASPIFNLPNYGQGPRDIADVHVTVNTDESGNFVSVESGGRTISLDEWNEVYEARDPGFIDPLNPINVGALELRETYGEVQGEVEEALSEIAEADGIINTVDEILEARDEIIWSVGTGASRVIDTTTDSVISTGVDIIGVGARKALNWFGN